MKKKIKSKTLVIVESPTKIRSLSKFLGKDYLIESSKGHLIDLPKSSMGVDVDNNFEPRYITIRGKGKTLAELKSVARKVNYILLATDPDREGEAISWHLMNVLSQSKTEKIIQRIEFNEITEGAVKKAIEHPRQIDLDRVNSQQARRILDRLVGYSISPVLQDKFGSKRFSAGRVQSACLRILCEREREIEKFKPTEYWEFEASFIRKDGKTKIKDQKTFFQLSLINNKKTHIPNSSAASQIEAELTKRTFELFERKESKRQVRPSAPYTTSRMQQEASTRLGFRAQKTMSVAQSLYEGVDLGDGQIGLITYMRTDSTRISEAGLKMVRSYIQENFDATYLPEKPNFYGKPSKGTQDAHEAIRPTSVLRTPESIEKFLNRDQFRLYQLIWKKFVSSQMTVGIDRNIALVLKDLDGKYTFRYSSTEVEFLGFRIILSSKDDKKKYVPEFYQGEKFSVTEILKEQKFTQPPPRYTEASLIKVMEESGIGRPATYVPTIATLDKRAYVDRKGRQLIPTALGKVVNKMMTKHFPDIVDLKFTAEMEEKLDEIAQGELNWRLMMSQFYSSFTDDIELAQKNMEDLSHLVRVEIGRNCPECNSMLMKKLGKNGFFIGCSNFAAGCRYTESIPLGVCPSCAGNVVRKKSQKGRVFYGCQNYSSTGCEFTMLDKPAERTCPLCNSIMGQKVKKSGILSLCQNEKCAHLLEEKNEES